MSDLSVPTIVRLYGIFSSKGWTKMLGQEIVHEKFCHLLRVLDEKEQELILELCERYEWFSFSEYGKLVVSIFENLDDLDPMPSKIYLAPLKRVSDENKTKSGDSLIYLLSGFIHLLPLPYRNGKYEQISLKDLASKKITVEKNEMVFFIDDFLGSGDTFKDMLEELRANETITIQNIKVLSLVAHQTGINLLQQMKVSYSIAVLQRKGISEYYDDPVKGEKIETMKKIEKNITRSKKLQFGYNQSEGTVTLIKTPNNTFPFFWMDYKASEILPPPFPRFQIK